MRVIRLRDRIKQRELVHVLGKGRIHDAAAHGVTPGTSSHEPATVKDGEETRRRKRRAVDNVRPHRLACDRIYEPPGTGAPEELLNRHSGER